MILTLGIGLAGTGLVGSRQASQVPTPIAQASSVDPAPPSPGVLPDLIGGGRPPRPPAPRPHDPAFENWQRAQTLASICMAMIAGGVILVLLGIVRCVFAIPERRFAQVPMSERTSS
jgi:hypothetical protein